MNHKKVLHRTPLASFQNEAIQLKVFHEPYMVQRSIFIFKSVSFILNRKKKNSVIPLIFGGLYSDTYHALSCLFDSEFTY